MVASSYSQNALRQANLALFMCEPSTWVIGTMLWFMHWW